MAYGPAGSAGRANSPRASDTVSLVRFVPWCVTTTFTPGRIAPELSWTTPYKVAVVTCARGFAEDSTRAAAIARPIAKTRDEFFILTSELGAMPNSGSDGR